MLCIRDGSHTFHFFLSITLQAQPVLQKDRFTRSAWDVPVLVPIMASWLFVQPSVLLAVFAHTDRCLMRRATLAYFKKSVLVGIIQFTYLYLCDPLYFHPINSTLKCSLNFCPNPVVQNFRHIFMHNFLHYTYIYY